MSQEMSRNLKSYQELIRFKTFEERLNYLRVGGIVGIDTFGYDRYLNQSFYHSPEWIRIRRQVILRDNGCDLGVSGYDIIERPIIHHINPITKDDVISRSPIIFDLNNLITTTHNTHNAIHYLGMELKSKEPVIRSPNDTCPWRRLP